MDDEKNRWMKYETYSTASTKQDSKSSTSQNNGGGQKPQPSSSANSEQPKSKKIKINFTPEQKAQDTETTIIQVYREDNSFRARSHEKVKSSTFIGWLKAEKKFKDNEADVKAKDFIDCHWIVVYLLLLLLLLGHVHSYNSASSTLRLGKDRFLLRPYSSNDDRPSLKEICKDVYGGTDDLPDKAQSLQDDPSCDFLVLQDESNGALVACGNLQFTSSCCFLEAIRVAPEYEGRGIGTLWMRELVNIAKFKKSREILSCTIDANHAMKRIFSKIDMVPVSGFCNPDWNRLLELPGWKQGDETKPQNLLKALQVEHLVKDASRRAGVWEPIHSYNELLEILSTISTIGHLPAVGKPMFLSKSLQDSLQRGLVRKLHNPNGDSPAIFALVKDPESHCDLKSDYVCSIVATHSMHLDEALWEACQPKYVSLMGGTASFSCIFEQPYPPVPFEEGSLQAFLPIHTEKVFINYRWRYSSNKQ